MIFKFKPILSFYVQKQAEAADRKKLEAEAWAKEQEAQKMVDDQLAAEKAASAAFVKGSGGSPSGSRRVSGENMMSDAQDRIIRNASPDVSDVGVLFFTF